MPGTDLRTVVANSANPVLKVKSDSKPNTVAGAICNVVRDAGNAPAILCTGPQAINQTIKAIAIARKYLQMDASPCDITACPRFEQDIRAGSNVLIELQTCDPSEPEEPQETDLLAKDKTDAFKLAGAIAGRVRENELVALTAKGPVPILIVVKAIALAEDYLKDEHTTLRFSVQFCDLVDEGLRGQPTSTYLHFTILADST